MKQVKIKSSTKLNAILNKIYALDGWTAFDNVDFGSYGGCMSDADIKDMAKLFNKAAKQQRDIYEVWERGGDVGYFVGTLNEVKQILQKNYETAKIEDERATKELKQNNLEKAKQEKELKQNNLEKAKQELKYAQNKIKSLKKIVK